MEKCCLNLVLVWHCHLCASDPGREGPSENGNAAIDLSARVELIITGIIPLVYKNKYFMAYSVNCYW